MLPYYPTPAVCTPCGLTTGDPSADGRASDRAVRLAQRLHANLEYLLGTGAFALAANNDDLFARTGAVAGFAQRLVDYIQKAGSPGGKVFDEANVLQGLRTLKGAISEAIGFLRKVRPALIQQKVGTNAEALQLAGMHIADAAAALSNAINYGRSTPQMVSAYYASLLAAAESQLFALAGLASSYLQGDDY